MFEFLLLKGCTKPPRDEPSCFDLSTSLVAFLYRVLFSPGRLSQCIVLVLTSWINQPAFKVGSVSLRSFSDSVEHHH